VLRIKIAVPRKESIPQARDILFYDEVTNEIMTYLLTSSIESASLVTDPWGPEKSHTYWQYKKQKPSGEISSQANIPPPVITPKTLYPYHSQLSPAIIHFQS
jgi:hypothetical protein